MIQDRVKIGAEKMGIALDDTACKRFATYYEMLVEGNKVMNLRIRGKAKVGDKAVVYLPPSAVTQASLIAYAIPAAGLLLGILLGDKLFPTENSLGGAIGGVLGVAIPALILWLTERRRSSDPRFTPQLVRVIPAENN